MSLICNVNETNYTDLSTRWGNTPSVAEACTSLSIVHEEIDDADYNFIADRWGNGVPYAKVQKLDGIAYIFECRYVDAIDRFMVSECSADLLRSDLDHWSDFVKFQDGELLRADLSALDDLLVNMVMSGDDCMTIQGANCG